MNRRNFLKKIGLSSAFVATAPILSLAVEKQAPKNKSIVFKVDAPFITLHSNGKSERLLVHTYKGTLIELLDANENHYIFLYKSHYDISYVAHYDISYVDGSEKKYDYTRALVIEKSKISHPASVSFVHPETKETIRYDIAEPLF